MVGYVKKLHVVRNSLVRAFRIAIYIWVGYVLIHIALEDFLSYDPEKVDSPYRNYAVHVFLYVLTFLAFKVISIPDYV
jgi:ABC-type glycerol-3-phosphate transport system permease component